MTEEQLKRFESWLQKVLWEASLSLPTAQEQPGTSDMSIHRVKGKIILASGFLKMVQGVRDVFEVTDLTKSTKGESNEKAGQAGKLVVIGRGLLNLPWEASMMYSLQAT